MTEIAERVDLHTHYVPAHEDELLNRALHNNVILLGALGHESVLLDHLRGFVKKAKTCGVRVLPGIEAAFTLRKDGLAIPYELICLGIDTEDPEIYNLVDPRGKYFGERHGAKVDVQISIAEEDGFDMALCEANRPYLEALHSKLDAATAILVCRAAAYNPQNKSRLSELQTEIDVHFSNRPQDAGDLAKFLYGRLFGIGKPGYNEWQTVRKQFTDITPEDYIDIMHRAGATVVLAHPNFQHEKGALPPSFAIEDFLDMSIDGLEGWDAGPLNIDLARRSLRRHKLVLGGSGWSPDYDNRDVGVGDKALRNMLIPPTILERNSTLSLVR